MEVEDNVGAVERPLRDRLDPLTFFEDDEFMSRFRMRKSSVILLTRTLEKDLTKRSDRGKPILPMLQVLVALRFFADGTVQRNQCLRARILIQRNDTN